MLSVPSAVKVTRKPSPPLAPPPALPNDVTLVASQRPTRQRSIAPQSGQKAPIRPCEAPLASTSHTSHFALPLAHNCAVVVVISPEAIGSLTSAGTPLASTRLKTNVLGGDASLRRNVTVIFVPLRPVQGLIDATAASLFSHSRCDAPLAGPGVGPVPPLAPLAPALAAQSGQKAPMKPCDVPAASTSQTSQRPLPPVHTWVGAAALRPETGACTCAGTPPATLRLKISVAGGEASLRCMVSVIVVPVGPVHGLMFATEESLFSHSRCAAATVGIARMPMPIATATSKPFLSFLETFSSRQEIVDRDSANNGRFFKKRKRRRCVIVAAMAAAPAKSLDRLATEAAADRNRPCHSRTVE